MKSFVLQERETEMEILIEIYNYSLNFGEVENKEDIP